MVPFLPLLPRYASWGNIKSGAEIGLWCAFGYVAQAVGLQTADASHGAFICSLAMVVVPVFKSLNGEKVSSQLWAAVGMAVMGTALLIGVIGGDGASVSSGDLICGGCALGFGLMFARSPSWKRVRARGGKASTRPPKALPDLEQAGTFEAQGPPHHLSGLLACPLHVLLPWSSCRTAFWLLLGGAGPPPTRSRAAGGAELTRAVGLGCGAARRALIRALPLGRPAACRLGTARASPLFQGRRAARFLCTV
ncbi:unnamed protein product [Prorocentrum cordatum]|uniref:EamA domain-containing protein n=1 Tax=Prorocentrum cordatum TaxID=2364126 RepID=A0ABN9WY77_9DINO|nr:unnamed protein product [Polarella glacialis]